MATSTKSVRLRELFKTHDEAFKYLIKVFVKLEQLRDYDMMKICTRRENIIIYSFINC